MSYYRIKILAEVETVVELGPNETLADLRRRDVDIYLHGPSPDGYQDKEDLGVYTSKILIKDLDEY